MQQEVNHNDEVPWRRFGNQRAMLLLLQFRSIAHWTAALRGMPWRQMEQWHTVREAMACPSVAGSMNGLLLIRRRIELGQLAQESKLSCFHPRAACEPQSAPLHRQLGARHTTLRCGSNGLPKSTRRQTQAAEASHPSQAT